MSLCLWSSGEDGGVLEIALAALEALGLNVAELLERFLELAGEALAWELGVNRGHPARRARFVAAWIFGVPLPLAEYVSCR